MCCLGTSLTVQWLRLCFHRKVGAGSIPGRGPRIPNATWCGQKILKIVKRSMLLGRSKMQAATISRGMQMPPASESLKQEA